MATLSALEAWAQCADYVVDCTDDSARLRPLFEAFLEAILPHISASPLELTADDDDAADAPAANYTEALHDSSRVLGFGRYVSCIHRATISGRCSLEGAIAALSGEGLHKDFTPETCSQMLSIFEAASKSGHTRAAPRKLRFVIRALTGNLETLFAIIETSQAQTSAEETLEWVRALAVSGLQSTESRLEAAVLLNRCMARGMRLGVAPPPQFLSYVMQTLQNFLDPQVESELVQAVTCALKGESLPVVREALQGLLPGLRESLEDLLPETPGPLNPGGPLLQRATQLTGRLQVILGMASEKSGYDTLAMASIEVLRGIWGLLAPILGAPEAASLRLAVAECCLAGVRCPAETAAATAALCCPAVGHLVDLEHGEKFVELVAEAVELCTPAPGGGHSPGVLDPEVVRQAVHAVAASGRLHSLSGLKAGDSDPEAAEAVLGALKRFAAAKDSPVSSSQAGRNLLQRGVGVATGGIPCSHRAVALAASSCMVALLDRANKEHERGERTLLTSVVSAGPQIVQALLLALMGPSAIVRVHRVVCILGGLARLPGQDPSLACTWLQNALPSTGITAEEQQSVARTWTQAMISGAGSGRLDSLNSFAGTRSGQQLKRHVRAFAERHTRAAM